MASPKKQFEAVEYAPVAGSGSASADPIYPAEALYPAVPTAGPSIASAPPPPPYSLPAESAKPTHQGQVDLERGFANAAAPGHADRGATKKGGKRTGKGRCCGCCCGPCCCIPRVCCILIWVVLGICLALSVIGGVTTGVMYGMCSSSAAAAADSGTLNLADLVEGTIEVTGYDTRGKVTVISSTDPAATNLTWTTSYYTRSDASKMTKATTELSGSGSSRKWTLLPRGEDRPSIFGFWFGFMCESTEIVVTVPAKALAQSKYALSVSARNWDVDLAGQGEHIWRDAKIRTTNGGVRQSAAIVRVSGELDVESTNGALRFPRVHLGPGAELDLETTNGGATVGIVPPAAPAPFEASIKSTNGGVTVTVPKREPLSWSIKTSNGGRSAFGRSDISAGGRGADSNNILARTIKIETTNGGATLQDGDF